MLSLTRRLRTQRALSTLASANSAGSASLYNGYQADLEQAAAAAQNVRDPSLPELIVPQFWTGTPAMSASRYVVDCTGADVRAEVAKGDNSQLVQEIKGTFEDLGVVHMKNTGLEEDLASMRLCAKLPMPAEMVYEGGANYRDQLVENVFDTGAPREAWLHYHHEMAYVNQSTRMLGFCAKAVCKEPGKGAMFLSDNVAVTRDILGTEFGAKLKERGICYIRCLTDREDTNNLGEVNSVGEPAGVYNHWQQSFGCDTIPEVEAAAKQKGLALQWGPGRYLRTKYYTSGFEYFPPLDTNLLYSSVADHDMWFDTWPGMSQLPRMASYADASPVDRPLYITYGDDSEMTKADLNTFVDAYDQHGFPISWETGDVVVVCNYRFAHGRPNYSLAEGEERELGVVLGEMFDRVGQKPGKWL